MELATNAALRTPQRPATAGELDARKDTLASAIRRYQAVRRTVPSDDQLAMVAAAEDNLIDAVARSQNQFAGPEQVAFMRQL